MRILNICFARGRGGIEQAFVDYGEALTLAGHEVHMLCDPASAYLEDIGRLNLPMHAIRQHGAWDMLAALRLRHALRHIAPQLVIAHGNRAISLLTAPAMRCISNPACPVTAVAHNYQLKRFSRLDGVFAITRDIGREVERRGLPAERVFLMPNMVRIPDGQGNKRHSPPVVGAMGRFVAKKGFDDLLRALSELQRKDIPFRAVIAGDGEEAGNLRHLCREYGLEDAVDFPGWVRDKAAFFAGCDIFCLPSRHEPFGIVLIEAMGHGLPIVSTRSEGPSEILEDGRDALLCDVGDAGGMAEALGRLLRNGDEAAELAEAAHAKVRREYSIEAASARLNSIVQACVGLGRAKI